MTRKLVIVISLILVVSGSINLFSVPVNSGKKGLDHFIEYLNSYKEELEYKTYGLLEYPDRVEIKIHCTDKTIGKILAGIEDFNYKKYTIERVSPNDVTAVVIFPRPGVEAVEEPTPDVVPKTEVEAEAAEKKEDCPRRVKVQVREVTPKIFMEYKYFEKPIVPAKRFDVIVPVDIDELVSEVLVKKGDKVTEGQVLLTFDSERINREILKAQSDLKSWKRILFKRENWKVRSPSAENQAKREIEKAEAQLAANNELLTKLEVKAPADGEVIFVMDKETGIGPDRVVAKILNNSVMKIDLPTEDRHLFKDGQKGRISFKDAGFARLCIVEKKDDSLKLIFKNDDGKLTGGMIASFRILLKKHEKAVVVDPKLLLKDEKGKFVYIVDGKYAKKAYLTLGPVEQGNILVLSGLSFGDEIIITGIECLEEGKKIRVVVKDPTTGKLKKRKKKKPGIEVVKPVVTKEPEETDKGLLKLNFGFGFNTIGEEVFKEVYGSSFISGYFGISYSIFSRIEMFLAASYVTKKGSFTEFEDEVTLTMIPLYAGARYKFRAISKFKPYIGAAYTLYSIKEKTATVTTPTNTGTGLSLNGGATMNLGSKFELFLDLKYDLVKLTIEDVESSFDFSGLRFTLGVAYKFKL
jgi:membrane fusion protein (multidrug efflux system)